MTTIIYIRYHYLYNVVKMNLKKLINFILDKDDLDQLSKPQSDYLSEYLKKIKLPKSSQIEVNYEGDIFVYTLNFKYGSIKRETYGLAVYGLTIFRKELKKQEKLKEIFKIKSSQYPFTYLLHDYTKPLENSFEGKSLFNKINCFNTMGDIERQISHYYFDSDNDDYNISGNKTGILADLFHPIISQIRNEYKPFIYIK